MLKQVESRVESAWHSDNPPVWTTSLSLLYRAGVALRRGWYKCLPSSKVNVPILVVGNISVGGTGKTPVVIALAKTLQAMGFTPGIVSRGYRSKLNHVPTQVSVYHQPFEVGDEPLLIHYKTQMPVVIGKNRLQAVKFLLAQNPQVNIILSDDGLQHYRMPRTKEIAMVDMAAFGNQKCLPAGPLREPLSRLKDVDYLLSADNRVGGYQVNFIQSHATKLSSGEIDSNLESFKGRKVHAVAGIANPQRFFDMLESKGIAVEKHVFPDHYNFVESDLHFEPSLPILMTEKDAIKCHAFKHLPIWSVGLVAQLDEQFVKTLVKDLIHG